MAPLPQRVPQGLRCGVGTYYSSITCEAPFGAGRCSLSLRLHLGVLFRGAVTLAVALAVLVAFRHSSADSAPALWWRKHARKVANVIPGIPRPPRAPLNMTEDIEEIGEQMFEAVVNTIAGAPVPPLPVLAPPALAATIAPTNPVPTPTMLAPLLTAPVLTDVPRPVRDYQQQLRSIRRPLGKYTHLMDLREKDPQALYRLLLSDLIGTLPYVYTPTVGEACEKFDEVFEKRPIPGLYIRATDKGRVEEVLSSWTKAVDIIVVTDGSRILGLGDLGANGMGIPIGKLELYTAIGGFDPDRTLPLTLDTGTDNGALRSRRTYQGLRKPRIADAEYFALLDETVAAVQRRWPSAVLQFEDFSSPHCFQLLEKYRHRVRTFNDDIQGTGAVITAGFINAAKVANVPLDQQRIVFFGAGAAGQGVAETIKSVMVQSGMTEQQARDAFYFVDSKGLVTTTRGDRLPPYKVAFARSDLPPIASLLDIVRTVRPTALIGLSSVPDAFSKAVVTEMAKCNARPIIFALSNPTSKSELAADKAIKWTRGKVVYAAGSPYAPVTYGGKTYEIAQGNNLYIFPGLGLGSFLSQATEISDSMVVAAAQSLADCVTADELRQGHIFPSLTAVRRVTANVAAGVMQQAKAEGLEHLPGGWPTDVLAYVNTHMWLPTL